MDVACPFYLPAAVIRSHGNDLCAVVVKLTFAFEGSGWCRLAQLQEALSGDRSDPGGRLLYPSDFGPPKQGCDVVVVGQILGERAMPLRLRAGRLKKQVEKPSMLGAIGRRGGDGGFASADQRMPFAQLPLEVSVERSGGAIKGTLPGPPPSAAIVYGGEWRAQYSVPLEVDGVLLDPARSICMLTLRGAFRHAAEQLTGLTLLLDPGGHPRTPPEIAAVWPRYPCESPPPEAPPPEEPLLDRGKGVTMRLDRPLLPALDAKARGATVRMSRAEALGLSKPDDDETTQVGLPVPPPQESPTGTFAVPAHELSSVDFDEADVPDANPTISMPAVSPARLPQPDLPLTRSTAMTADAKPHDSSRETLPFSKPAEPPKRIVFGERPVAAEPAPPPLPTAARMLSDETAGLPLTAPTSRPPNAMPFEPPRPPSSSGQLAGGLPFQPPRPPPSSSGLPFVGGPAAPEAPPARRPMMMVGTQGTPLAYPPTPFSNAGPKASPPAAPPRTSAVRSPSSSPPPLPTPPPSAPVAPVSAPSAPARTTLDALRSELSSASASASAPAAIAGAPSFMKDAPPEGRPPSQLRQGRPPLDTISDESGGPPELRVEGLSLSEFSQIRESLLTTPKKRRAVLKQHGLGEVRWRMIERRWASHFHDLDDKPDELVALATDLRKTARSRRKASSHAS